MIKLEDIKFRVNTTGESGGKYYATCLVYVDARTVNRELNKKYGEGNWQFGWSEISEKFAVKGILKIYDEKKKEWLMYQDVGYCQGSKMYAKEPGKTEFLKDAVSDAKKRCAVQVGIGELLYEAPLLYTNSVKVINGKVKGLTPKGKIEIQEKVDKWYKYDIKKEKDLNF